MKYFIDTEFLEGTQTKRVLGFNVGQTKPTVDLISIGIVSKCGWEYYAISKEFNLKEAWNRFELKPDIDNGGMKKVYWIRENVLKPIWNDLNGAEVYGFFKTKKDKFDYKLGMEFSYRSLKYLLNEYGKTNSQIAKEVKEFVYKPYHISNSIINNHKDFERALFVNPISFYGYYADYDWVVFCWLFGKMIDLPQGFPMYCNDLKQILETRGFACNGTTIPLEMWGKDITEHPNYPAQKDEHNALADARWNKKLYEFLKSL
jgi:hypothetical protein